MGFSKHQTKKEKALRRAKYTLLRARGYNHKASQRMMDWRTKNVCSILWFKPEMMGE